MRKWEERDSFGVKWERGTNKGVRRQGRKKAYINASSCTNGIGKAHTGYAVGFLVEEDDVCDGGDFGAFFADVLFNVEHRCGVFL